ncbi:hypothetical protein CIPAW_05G169000 [Carya illinoinensis]|uniref:Uncharacterized protein n=1 Tax=Carya illinoinensis TaxID=32201 RepID=A0A8T1QL16_CARIL|nr:hypothetical protein CIPAW_05G169000 [Carya illinoinensis]
MHFSERQKTKHKTHHHYLITVFHYFLFSVLFTFHRLQVDHISSIYHRCMKITVRRSYRQQSPAKLPWTNAYKDELGSFTISKFHNCAIHLYLKSDTKIEFAIGKFKGTRMSVSNSN